MKADPIFDSALRGSSLILHPSSFLVPVTVS